jgi:hypothetical protein
MFENPFPKKSQNLNPFPSFLSAQPPSPTQQPARLASQAAAAPARARQPSSPAGQAGPASRASPLPRLHRALPLTGGPRLSSPSPRRPRPGRRRAPSPARTRPASAWPARQGCPPGLFKAAAASLDPNPSRPSPCARPAGTLAAPPSELVAAAVEPRRRRRSAAKESPRSCARR